MTTAADIITDAHLFAGIGDVYNPVDANNTAMALRFLNTLLDSVSNEEYSVFDYIDITVPLVSGTQVYTVGPGQLGTPAVRPNLIEVMYIEDSSLISHPVSIVGMDQWAGITFKTAPGRPEYALLNYNATTIDISLYPRESFAGDTLHIFNYAVLQSFANAASLLIAPPGYTEWLVTALGKRLAIINKVAMTQDQKDIIAQAYRNMRAQNRDIHVLDTDLPVSDRTAFNIFTGNNNP